MAAQGKILTLNTHNFLKLRGYHNHNPQAKVDKVIS